MKRHPLTIAASLACFTIFTPLAATAAPEKVISAKDILKAIQPAPEGIRIGKAKKDAQPQKPVTRGGMMIAPGWKGGVSSEGMKEETKSGPKKPNTPKVIDSEGNKVTVALKRPTKAEAGKAIVKGSQLEVYPASKFEFPIHFALNSYTVTPGFNTRQLDELAKALTKVEKSKFLLEGHTCDLGHDTYNDWLSAARAIAVKGYLLRKGVSTDQLICRGFGESDPLARPNKSYTARTNEEIRSKNRRVVIRMIVDK